MADLARFRAVTGLTQSSSTDQPITLENGTPTAVPFTIDLSGLDPTSAAILMFKGEWESWLALDHGQQPNSNDGQYSH